MRRCAGQSGESPPKGSSLRCSRHRPDTTREHAPGSGARSGETLPTAGGTLLIFTGSGLAARRRLADTAPAGCINASPPGRTPSRYQTKVPGGTLRLANALTHTKTAQPNTINSCAMPPCTVLGSRKASETFQRSILTTRNLVKL